MKFTLSGGSVIINCKKILTENNLTYFEEQAMQEVIQKSKFVMIEILVQDSDVRIKEENLQKLFKIF